MEQQQWFLTQQLQMVKQQYVYNQEITCPLTLSTFPESIMSTSSMGITSPTFALMTTTTAYTCLCPKPYFSVFDLDSPYSSKSKNNTRQRKHDESHEQRQPQLQHGLMPRVFQNVLRCRILNLFKEQGHTKLSYIHYTMRLQCWDSSRCHFHAILSKLNALDRHLLLSPILGYPHNPLNPSVVF
jgi:hypothetical protein